MPWAAAVLALGLLGASPARGGRVVTPPAARAVGGALLDTSSSSSAEAIAAAGGRRFAPARAFVAPLTASRVVSGPHGAVDAPLATRPAAAAIARPSALGAASFQTDEVGAASFDSELAAHIQERFMNGEGESDAVAKGEDVVDWVQLLFNDEAKSDELLSQLERGARGRLGEDALGLEDLQKPHLDDYVDDAWRQAPTTSSEWGKDSETEATERSIEAVERKHKVQYTLPVVVEGSWNGMPGPLEIDLPASWMKKFAPDSIRVHGGQSSPSVLLKGTARLAADPSRLVQFTALQAGTDETWREYLFAEVFSLSGMAPVTVDIVDLPSATYFLQEPCTTNVAQLLAAQAQVYPDHDATTHMQVPVQTAVPVMFAMIGALMFLEESGIVHASLTEDNIFIADGGRRVMFTNFFGSYLKDPPPGHLHYACDHDHMIGSAWRQPPELEGERVYGSAGNVWQLGLVFAKMVFGGDLVTHAAVQRIWSHRNWDDTSLAGRAHIRQAIRDTGILPKLAPGYRRFSNKYRGLVTLVEGMLAKDPADRWTTQDCLTALIDVAEEEGIKLDWPDAEMLTEDWRRIWEEQEE